MLHEGSQNWLRGYNSRMCWPILAKFGVCLETRQLCMLHMSWVGYICMCTRPHMQVCPFSVSRKWVAECAEIWCVVRNQLARHFTKV